MKVTKKNNKNLTKKYPLAPDLTTRYMVDISKYPLLTKEEEFELAKKLYHEKDQTAAQKLVTSNLRFVVKIASEYTKFNLKLIDLIQEGNIGLLIAVKKFNPYKGTRLTTYAVWWIRSYINNYMLNQWSLVKIGTTASQKKLFYRLKQEQEKLENYLNGHGMPKLIEHKIIADKLGVKEKEVAEMDLRLQGGDLSLNSPLNQDETINTFMDNIADSSPSPEEIMSKKDEKSLFLDNLDDFKDTLDERDTFILNKRLLSDDPLSLQDIGKKYNISRERARQLEERIKKNLKKFISSKKK